MAEGGLACGQHACELVEVVDDVAQLLVLVGQCPHERAEVCHGVVEGLTVALQVVGRVLHQAPRGARVEAVEELLQGRQGLVGLDRHLRPLLGDDIAGAGPRLAVGPHREELDVALADEREGHDGGVHVGGDGHGLLDLHVHAHPIAHGRDLADLAGRETEYADVGRREQGDGLGEPGRQDVRLGSASADDGARGQGDARQEDEGRDASQVGHVTP